MKELLDRFERAAMAYERLGKLTRDDEKTRQIRVETIAELAEARKALMGRMVPLTVPIPSNDDMEKIRAFMGSRSNRIPVLEVVDTFVTLMDQLLEEEGATVEFTGGNPDFNGLPNHVVSVTASFTNWDRVDFRADTREECLKQALARKTAWGTGS